MAGSATGPQKGLRSKIQRRVRIRDAQLTAAEVSSRRFRGKCGNSSDISKGISQSGMSKFESSQVSQAFWRTDLTTSQCVKDRNSGPFTLGFCLHGPILHSESAKRPKVSSRLRNYSRFAETAPGDFGSIGTAGRPASWQRLLISLSSKKLISSDFGARLGVEAGTGLGKS